MHGCMFIARAVRDVRQLVMTLLDIIANGKDVRFEDILKRQELIANRDLRTENYQTRVKVLEEFYAYRQEVPSFRKTWTQGSSDRRAAAASLAINISK